MWHIETLQIWFLLLFLSKKEENRSKINHNKLLLIALKSTILFEAPKVTARGPIQPPAVLVPCNCPVTAGDQSRDQPLMFVLCSWCWRGHSATFTTSLTFSYTQTPRESPDPVKARQAPTALQLQRPGATRTLPLLLSPGHHCHFRTWPTELGRHQPCYWQANQLSGTAAAAESPGGCADVGAPLP